MTEGGALFDPVVRRIARSRTQRPAEHSSANR